MPLVMFVLRSHNRTVVVDTGGPADEERIRRRIPSGTWWRRRSAWRTRSPAWGCAPTTSILSSTPTCTGTTARTTTRFQTPRSLSTRRVGPRHRPSPESPRAYVIHGDSVPPFARCMDRVRALDGASEIVAGRASHADIGVARRAVCWSQPCTSGLVSEPEPQLLASVRSRRGSRRSQWRCSPAGSKASVSAMVNPWTVPG